MNVSVITPTRLLPDRVDLLVELHQSLQVNSCAVEHVIVIDGGSSEGLPAELLDRATVYASPKPIGQAAARNIGLSLAQGDWITSVDDDDLLTPYSIDLRLAALDQHPQARWAAGSLSDGTDRPMELIPPGLCAPGDVWRAWPQPEGTIPLGPTSLLMPRTLIRQVGGWMGLFQGEDLGMMMAITSIAPGVMVDACVYYYRMHPGQMTKGADFDDLEPISRRCAWQRGAALVADHQAAGGQA